MENNESKTTQKSVEKMIGDGIRRNNPFFGEGYEGADERKAAEANQPAGGVPTADTEIVKDVDFDIMNTTVLKEKGSGHPEGSAADKLFNSCLDAIEDIKSDDDQPKTEV